MIRLALAWILFVHCCAQIEHPGSRIKKDAIYSPPIVYPFGGTIKLVVGFAVPIQLTGRILVYGQNMQFQYALPQNASIFTSFFNSSSTVRRRRSTATEERMAIYNFLEEESNRMNINGRDCLKKSICDAAKMPVENEGLVGELLHILLTPDHGGVTTVHPDYLEAAEFGRKDEDCSEIYKSCLPGHGILDRISRFID